jgi:hypothetical protein
MWYTNANYQTTQFLLALFQKLANYICSTSVRRICTLSGSGEEFCYSALYDFVHVNSLMIPTAFIVMYPDYICWYNSLCVTSTLKLSMFAVNGYFRHCNRRPGLNSSDPSPFWDITQDYSCVISHRHHLLRGGSLKSRMGSIGLRKRKNCVESTWFVSNLTRTERERCNFELTNLSRLQNPRNHYFVQKSAPLETNLGQFNPSAEW